MTDYRARIGEAIAFARCSVGSSQQELAELLGRDKRTLQKWEKGDIKVTLEDFLEVFNVLGVPAGPYAKWVRHPEFFPRGMEDIRRFSSDNKRRAVIDYYQHHAAPVEIEQEYYILFGDHGSSYYGIRQEQIANLQTSLRDRKYIARQVINNYLEALADGQLTDPEAPQPIIPLLRACYDACAESVRQGKSGYSIENISAYLEEEEKQGEGQNKTLLSRRREKG